jgi:hypothetical protein
MMMKLDQLEKSERGKGMIQEYVRKFGLWRKN